MSASVDDNVIRPREFERVKFSIDVGRVSAGHPYVGQFVITLQVAPFRHLDEARQVERAIREAVWSRCGLKTRIKNGDANGRTRTRTLDPLIKSQRISKQIQEVKPSESVKPSSKDQ
jgi:hypothetical protein